jgi:hypothetical protein
VKDFLLAIEKGFDFIQRNVTEYHVKYENFPLFIIELRDEKRVALCVEGKMEKCSRFDYEFDSAPLICLTIARLEPERKYENSKKNSKHSKRRKEKPVELR